MGLSSERKMDAHTFITTYVNVHLNPLIPPFEIRQTHRGYWEDGRYFLDAVKTSRNPFDEFLRGYRDMVLSKYEILSEDSFIHESIYLLRILDHFARTHKSLRKQIIEQMKELAEQGDKLMHSKKLNSEFSVLKTHFRIFRMFKRFRLYLKNMH